ncbi:hypothetical protein E4T50_15589 [Aureobasidium sp. EXF-12298]|nr:hypothetical protein E4T50_15589 [Aureobasidium sp. EXF-12298]
MDNGREGLITHGFAPRRHPTWRIVVIINTILVSLVLIVYVSFLIWIYTNLEVRAGVAELFKGSCLETSKVTTYARLATCAFAVLLFAVGTHAVQLLLSPTRAEVENAHARDRWLHIGVGGLRNMKWIHKRRLIRAVVLLTTSVLLPLLHTSMIFTTVATTDTAAALVTGDYPTGSRLDGAMEQSIFLAKAEHYRNISKSSHAALTTINYDDLLQQMRRSLTDLVHLSPQECRSAYSSFKVPSGFSNVLLVTPSNFSNTIDGFVDGDLLYPEMITGLKYEGVQVINWFNTNGTASIFHNHCVGTIFDFGNGSTWNIPVWDYYCTAASYPVDYCLAQKFELDCGVALNTRILIGIIACLIMEVGCLTSLAVSRGFRPLATVGDAVASFLRHPESSISKFNELTIPAVHAPTSRFDKFGFRRSEKDIAIWKRKWPVWRAAVDTETCALFINISFSLFLVFFAIATAVVIIYNNNELSMYQPLTLQTPTSSRGLLANLMILGSIHLAISIIYLLYNHLWSRMLVASKLNSFAKTPASLRVTLPVQGAQNTYHLAIKPHYSAMLLIALIFFHFLTARAFNVVAIQTYDVLGQYSHQRITYGISTSSAILALALGFFMLIVLAFALERKLDGQMPVMGSCSMAISAACGGGDVTMALRKVRYGRDERTGRMRFLSS